MKRHQKNLSVARHLLNLALAAGLALPLPALAASVALATSPLATSTTSTVKPNLLFILDNSGSMDWLHMPDDADDGGSAVSFNFGHYGLRSSQCNQVYYDPNTTYLAPVNADGTSFTDSNFSSAEPNGFNTSGTNVDLRSNFRAEGDSSGQAAYYYSYSGTQDTQQEKNYHSTTNTFYSECSSAQNSATGLGVFTKISLSSTATETTATIVANCSSCTSTSVSGIVVNGAEEIMSGTASSSTTSSTVAANIAAQINLCTNAKVGDCTTVGGHGYTATVSDSTVTINGLDATTTSMIVTKSGSMTISPTIIMAADSAKLTNFANWYSFYRSRMLMMKTAAGHAFSSLNNSYRVGMMKISQTTPVVYMDTFEGTHRSTWYNALYNMATDGSTPLRRSLSDAGRYYAGKLSGTDPVQYSCQQNFTILSTDGYWNTGDSYKIDGTTVVDNQDGTAGRPYYDGSALGSSRSTSQRLMTQTQVRQSTTQLQQRIQETKASTSNLQRQISQLQTRSLTLQQRSSQLQSSTMYLQTRTRAKNKSWSLWSAWSDTASCTWDTKYDNVRECRYATAPAGDTLWTAAVATWTDTSSCNRSYSTSTSNGTTWSGNGTDCRYLDDAWSDVASCTPVAKDATDPYSVGTATECQTVFGAWSGTSSCIPDATTECQTAITTPYANASSCATNAVPDGSGNTTQCRYTTFTSYAYANSCTDAPQDATDPYDMTATNGLATQCQITDSGWVGVNSCTPSSSTGYTRTCQTVNTGPTLVSSCVSASKSAANNYTQTSCSTSTITAATPVASCTDTDASAANNYVTTTCTTASSGPTTVASCTAAAASASNNWTATTCSPVVTGGGSSNNLADIAMYYYQTDLRTSTLSNCTGALGQDVCTNNVFIGGNDNNSQQHMTTFTLGLGASGWMNYSSSYLNDTSGDYYDVKQGSTASASVCTWQTAGTTCNWPIPGMSSSNGLIANIDDLWHAAVNGRGAYFSATDPASLSSGLSNALAGINARKGSAAAAATSTLNPVAGNNYAYVASYTTVTWKGNLEARGINTITGAVNENATWCAENVVAGTCAAPGAVVAETIGDTTVYYCVTPDSVICTEGTLDGTDCKVPVATACTGTMNSLVADVTDSRTIKTANSTATGLVDFAYANLTPAQQAYFAAANIGTLSQWSTLTATQKTAAAGLNLVNYLRGQYGYEDRNANPEDNRLYRYREAVLGDALESQPAFIGKPVFSYPYPGYDAYKTAQTNRAGTVYMGANDGMMHAFAADTGVERWAYVPSMVIPNMWKLADTGYATAHRNFANGSPITSDICTANCSNADFAATADTSDDPVWKTILVAGLNGGGRGYFALDITDPDAPALLWEFTPSTGTGSVTDDDLGYSFGQPVITRKADGTWVVLVTSGYNNTSPGNGEGYLYVLNASTGAIISKIATNVGNTTTPSGLAKISGWNDEPAGNLAGYVYGGDLLGNVWRFDINSVVTATPADGEIGTGDVMKFAALYSDAGGANPQPITTTPVLGKIAGKRVIFVGTGKYLETGDLTTTQPQTQYAIKDDNATTTLVNPRNSLVRQTLSNNTDGSATRITTGNAVDFYTGRGWFVDFPDSGERVNIDSKLVEGTLLVPTIVPSNTVCAPGGYGWLNFFDYKTGGAINTDTDLASLKYDATIVGVNVLYVGGVPKVGVVTSTNPTPELNESVEFPATAAGFSGKRVIWRELIP